MTATQMPAPGPASDKAGDPSMEDILASIRRILSEDEGKRPGDPMPFPHQSSIHLPFDGPTIQQQEVLTLDASMLVDEPASVPSAPVPHPDPFATLSLPGPETVSPLPEQPPVVLSPPPITEPVAVQPATPLPPEPPIMSPASDEGLVAPEAAAAAATSVGSLLRHLQAERQMAVHRGGPTIEDIVREEMRPILKQWLDAHLPPLVERLVRAEIERVVTRSVS